MNVEKCVEFANKNPLSWVTSIEGNQPRVRALGMWFADENGYYFQIRTSADMYKQLQENPKVEASFWKPGEMFGTMLRVAGEVEFLDDVELKKRVLEDRPFLKDFGLSPENPELIIFRISKGEVYFWTIENAFQPKEMIEFGNE